LRFWFSRRLATRAREAIRQLGGWRLAGMGTMAALLFVFGAGSSAAVLRFVQRPTASPVARPAPLPGTAGSPELPTITTQSPGPSPISPASPSSSIESPDPSAVPPRIPIPMQSPTSNPNPSVTAAPFSPAATPSPLPQLYVRITAASYGQLAASTLPGAQCTAKARWPSGNDRQVQGLQGSRVADAFGSVSWSYATDPQAPSGQGTYTVTCTLGAQTQTATATFTIP